MTVEILVAVMFCVVAFLVGRDLGYQEAFRSSRDAFYEALRLKVGEEVMEDDDDDQNAV